MTWMSSLAQAIQTKMYPQKQTREMTLSLFEPRLFNFIIMGLYLLSATWWAAHGRWADTAYWLSALAITATVTFGYRH